MMIRMKLQFCIKLVQLLVFLRLPFRQRHCIFCVAFHCSVMSALSDISTLRVIWICVFWCFVGLFALIKSILHDKYFFSLFKLEIPNSGYNFLLMENVKIGFLTYFYVLGNDLLINAKKGWYHKYAYFDCF